MTTVIQLELELAGANRGTRITQPDGRANRANWWFNQMRQIVDRAFDWEPAPRFRPEQILFADSHHR